MAATIVAALVAYGLSELAAYAVVYVAMMAVSMAVSMVVNEILSPSTSSGGQVDTGQYKDPGVQTRLRVNTGNKLGVGYGTYWCKGMEVWGRASLDFKNAYYAIALTEVVNNGGSPNTLKKVYWEEYELTIGMGNTVTGVNIVGDGKYTTWDAPTIVFDAPPAGGVMPEAYAVMSWWNETEDSGYYRIESINVTKQGSGYTTAPNVTAIGGAVVIAPTLTASMSVTDGWVTSARDVGGNIVNDFNNNVRIQFFANGMPADRSIFPSYSWLQTATNQMTNITWCLVTLKYSREKQIFGLKDMIFCLSNNLTAPGDVLKDYMTNTVYGAALDITQVDVQSLTALNTYAAEMLPSVTQEGVAVNLPRYVLSGVVPTSQNCWKNIEDLMQSCGCYPRVNNMTGQYGVYIDKKADVRTFSFDDTTMIGASSITTAEYASAPNSVQVKFPAQVNPENGTPDDAFKGSVNSLNLYLPSTIIPANSQENQYTLDYRYLQNEVQAKRLAAVDLNNNVLDLSFTFRSNYKALDVVSGDVVSITNSMNGWLNKAFRIISVAEIEDQVTGNITLEFFAKEYNVNVYTDSTVVQYPIALNTNAKSPRAEQSYIPPAPIITGVDMTLPVPSLSLSFTLPTDRVEDQIDIYYMVGTPDINKAIFMFTVYGNKPDGSFNPGTYTYPVLGNAGLYAPQVVPAGDYFFAYKYYNDSLGTSLSLISNGIKWRPNNTQWAEKYIAFLWAVDGSLAGANTNPMGKRFMGIYNSVNPVGTSDTSKYRWFDLGSTISGSNQLFFRIFQNRVLTYRLENASPDSTLWSNAFDFPDPVNPVFDMDETTGFYVKTAYQAGGSNYLTSVWNADGSITYLLPPNTAVPGTTPITEINAITVDAEGRVVGYGQTEKFYFTDTEFTATVAGQTFTLNHVIGQTLVFMNGILLDPTDYTETATSITIPSVRVGYTVQTMSFLETNGGGGTQYVPYVRTDIPTVQGQTTYSIDFNEGAELVFLNGSFMNDSDYTIPVLNTLQLTNPPIVSGMNLTVINFRVLSGTAAPFGQAAGATIAGQKVVAMNGKINIANTVAAQNGVYLSPTDFTSSTDSLTLIVAALFSNNAVQSTTFASSGPADEEPPITDVNYPTIGELIDGLNDRITLLENSK